MRLISAVLEIFSKGHKDDRVARDAVRNGVRKQAKDAYAEASRSKIARELIIAEEQYRVRVRGGSRARQ